MPSRTPITLSFLSVIALVALAACGGASTDPHTQLDRTFREIQVHEAGIEHSRMTLARGGAACDEQCGACVSAAQHAERVCQLARTVADVDALGRCDQAEQISSGIAADARARCECTRD
jgi:hypothetical protein